jgi:hypothetical protein
LINRSTKLSKKSKVSKIKLEKQRLNLKEKNALSGILDTDSNFITYLKINKYLKIRVMVKYELGFSKRMYIY